MGMMDVAFLLPELGDKEQCSDNWNLVIKVRHDGILKRFEFSISGQQTNTEYDMDKLKAKISDIFNFSHDEVLIFTYTDEDGDEVNLDKDEELYDAVISQKLKPLRINVHVKSQSADGSNFEQNASTNSGDIFDKKSPEAAVELKFNVEESLKSIPASLRSAFAVLSLEALQVVLGSPNFSEFLVLLCNLQGSNAEFQASIKRTELIDFSKPSSSKSPENGNLNTTDEQMKDIEFHCRKEKALADSIAVGDNSSMKNIYQSNPNIHSLMLKERKLINQRFPCDLTTLYPINPMLSIQTQKGSTSHVNALQNKTQYPTTFPLHSPIMYPEKNSSDHRRIYPHLFHGGIICSGCGMNPIIGPRYKSSLEEFHLCSSCFHCVSRRTNFTKIDWPTFCFPKETIDNDDHSSHIFSNLSPRMKMVATPKLDSCFIRDLSIWDGTVVSPSSSFTKIWRMRNNGNIPWPIGTQLLRIRGDYLNDHDSIKLEIPEKGIPVEEELDIAIDLISPSTLGRYTSYWQMVSPIGNKFGEEIWVIIQVDDAHLDSSYYDTHSLFNSNFPPQTSFNVNESNKYNDEAMECLTEKQKANRLVDELLKSDSPDILSLQALKIPSFLKYPNGSQSSSLSCAFKGSHDIPTSSSPFPPIPTPSTLILNPLHQNDNPPLTYAEVVAKPPPDVLAVAAAIYNANDTDEGAEEFMLREMEEIGIVQIDQKKQFVGNPCAFTESDALLEELQELGFVDSDVSTNKNTSTMCKDDNLTLTYAEVVAKSPPDVLAAASAVYTAHDSDEDTVEFMLREMKEIGIGQIDLKKQYVGNPCAFTASDALREELRELGFVGSDVSTNKNTSTMRKKDNLTLTYAEVVTKPPPDVFAASSTVYAANKSYEDIEEFMLREMEEIGIVQIDQKKQSVGNPGAFIESDALRKELRELGFVDDDESKNRNTNTMRMDDNLPLTYAKMVAKPPFDVSAAASCSYAATDSDEDAEDFMLREMEELGIVQIDQRRKSVGNHCAFPESNAIFEHLWEMGFVDGKENTNAIHGGLLASCH